MGGLMLKNPFPAYEKELKCFVEITPRRAKKYFKYLCRKKSDVKYKSIVECLVFRSSHKEDKKQDPKRRERELERACFRRTGEKMPEKEKEIEQKPKSTFDEWMESFDEIDYVGKPNAQIEGAEITKEV
jgi:hypothetical protein